ncbi:centromere-associated protein E isoform X2 [Corapipo altera]|uniref:centromere-associated protein E isoform X2 n=1 Tax=Corapipo altera TaxID=415028 RepID=UPI000FD65A53|nr:centromere-associated protein E isoform X2 [Corapipo altera]
MADEGAVTVCVRVRPLIARENASGDKVSLHWKSENNTVSDVNGTKIFSYDHVFHSSDNTQQLYDGVAVPIIQSAVRGYNGTIFAYGQTASGKTYTMMGNEDSVGIIPKAIQHVFKIICEIPDREFLLRVSYMEIYNETITDLLCDSRKKKPLGIREDINRNTYVEDLIEEVVVAPEQVMEWIRKGERNRHYGETKMNEHSSRSHTIFRMIIESRERSDPANANCDGAVMVSHLNLVDLAGSERASQTGSEGVRLKEGCNINRNLFILGQVIKKLCDDPSGFINYRDSKLTRILQNSLGGNAKTVIICTITPVSFDETLSTLQFANTAKGMKNTPKVNEVLDDNALLKRYRKEIVDLKKQLEEVSVKTQIHAMEKDQLAQLLEEKNSLQKVQEDKIRNLTEMLVTAASFASKDNVKTKRRRRVTWAPGKIKQTNVSYFEDFEKDMPTETKKKKMSLSALPDADDSMLDNSECDNQSLMVPDQISEVEWIAGPKMTWTQKDFEESVQLCEAIAFEKDIAVNKASILQANLDNLVLENEQLKLEINEIKEKLKEKKEIDEFEALEKQTQKDHEIQLMHEITNLKNLVSNSEAYNEELQAENNSKSEQLKEKDNKIKILQNLVEELQKARVEKEISFSVGDSDKLVEEIQQLNKSLLDSEAIALDAKKESAFLRTENLELKEKMNELLNNHNQMQKDVQLYQSQIEAGKASYRKMQADLQRELQSVFQENLRLTSLLEGKVPKDLLTPMELEKKAADLKGELEETLKENALLQKQVNELSEFQSLPNTVEMQKKEILEKCEELRLLKLENEKLLSEVADNEIKLKHMTEEIEKSKDDLADAQLKYMKSDQEYVALKQLHEEMEQKYIATSENNEKMKLQIECLSKETQESKTTLDEIKLELSSKMKELEEKTAEQKQLLELREDFIQTQQKLNEMEQLKEEERMNELRLEAKDSEIQAVLQQLTECQEEIKTLTQEKDYLKQKAESLQAETDQLKEDIKDTVSMNILAHEELRNTQSSLKQSQATVKKLEKYISENESHVLSVEEALGKTIKELETQISQMTEEMKIIKSERDQLAEEKSESHSCIESDQLQEQKEQIIFLTQENRSLQEKLDSLHLKKEEVGEGTWVPQVQEKSLEQELLVLREKLSQAQRQLHEMEEAKASECRGESDKMGRRDFIPKLHDCQEVSTQTEREEDDLKMQLENLQNERDQLRETVQETIRKNSEMQKELQCTHRSLGQHQETIVELKDNISEKENQLSKAQEALKEKTDELQQKLTEVTERLTHVSSEYGKLLAEKEQIERTMNEQVCQQLEKITVLSKEKDELQQMVETCKEREEHLLKVQRRSEILEDSLTSKIQQLTDTLNSVSCEKDQLLAERTSHSFQLREQIASVNQEKDELQKLLQDVRTERDQLKTELQRNCEMELLEKFSNMGKRCECLSTVSLKLKSELNSQKALIAVILPQLSLVQSKRVKRLQTENEKLNGHLQSLLNKLKFMFSRVCTKKRDYHTTVNKYKMELLEEKRRQDHLQAEIQYLRKIHLNQNEIPSQELNISEGLQSFHLDAESILKDVSEMESELLCIEAELQQQESARKETVQFWEACSGTHCNAEELEEELKKDTERLLQVINFWTPKVKMLLQLSSELDARTSNDSKNADVELKQRKEKNEKLLQDLNTLKEKLAPDSSASLMLKEENYRLHNKLKAAEQDVKAMEVKIQKLENVINEVGENVKEKDDRINKLQAQISIKTETSELTQLQAKLNEMDKCLRTALTENQSLQAKLDKGSELYKEEIDHLKTQLVKCDMERMKQSNLFEMKLANYKALSEHREQELTRLKEELRRAHQDQDVTVLKEAASQQSQIPLTCGGGSGIVQSTQILVLKSEQAKIQKENLHLKKQNDLLLSNERQLKEELRKWKERALKWRERSLRENTRETIPQSPKKTVSYFFKEQMLSPSKEPISQEIVTQDLSKPLPLSCPTNFFDNSSFGMLTDTCPAATQSTEEHLKHLFGTSDKDKAPDCSTQ